MFPIIELCMNHPQTEAFITYLKHHNTFPVDYLVTDCLSLCSYCKDQQPYVLCDGTVITAPSIEQLAARIEAYILSEYGDIN